MRRKRIIEIALIIIVVFSLTIGFSAYGNQGTISGATASVKLQDDLRITSATYNSATNSGSSISVDHGKYNILSSINLPNSSSTVTYNVELTNFGNVTKGIYAITNLPSNLTYSISGYNIRDDICDSSGKCTLGAKKEFTITIKYTSNGYTSSQTKYDINIIFDFRPFYTLTWTKYDLIYGYGDRGTTTTERMKYSISNDIVTVTATADDGYGFITYRVDLEAGKTYVFNAVSSGPVGSSSGTDTVEGYLMKDCAYNYYMWVGINSPTELKPTQSGTYCLRLDVNKNGATHTFKNISIAEVVGSSRIAHNEKLSAVSGTLPAISKTGYTYIGYFDSLYRDAPFNFYADAYRDLYNAFGYNQESLWTHYRTQGGPVEGRQVSQYIGNTNYTSGKSQYIYGYLKATSNYTITYNANNGSGAPSAQSTLVNRNLVMTNDQPTRSGYVFSHWNTAADGSGSTYSPGQTVTLKGNITLYAQWIKQVTVNYNANGGSGAPSAQTTLMNYSLTLSSTSPTRTGYSFSGWNTASNGSGTTYQPNQTINVGGDITLYAQWIKHVTVSYNANGGSGAPSAQTTLMNYSMALSATTPTRSGYFFSGWNSASDGSGTTYQPNQTITVGGDMTLYAQWIQAVTISYYKTADLNWAAATIYPNLTSETGPVSGNPNYVHCAVSPPTGTSVSASSLDFGGKFTSESNRNMQSFTIPFVGTTVRWQNPNQNVTGSGPTHTLSVPIGTKLTFTVNNKEYHGQYGAIYNANSTDSAYRVWGPGESKTLGTYTYTVNSNVTVRANWKTSGEYVPGLTEFIKYIGVGSSTDDRNSWWDVHIY